ncbi:MAG: UDP-N-acetylmuramate--L-alanine ligase [Flavobacteriales bacterium TMED235]|nr:MAG: UDP-N-acetylmuramate--L-alanine ligase [Flavobacteriales bacterium TMED235]
MKIELAKNELIHFVGIGGIGMNGLAIIMKGLGFNVQGSDLFSNKNIDNLKKKKIKTFIGHNKKNLKNSTILVVSSAIKKNNPEYIEAKKRRLPIHKRGEMLGHIVSLMKNIVVAGSHGKTTTTSLISSIFLKSNIDATVINGGILNAFENSARLGKSDWCILESDESDGSFLNLPMTYSIVTNLDLEHLDYYKSLDNLKKNFINFINKTPLFGKNFICIDDKNNKSIISKLKNTNYLTYGVDKKSNFRILNISQNILYSKFDIKINIPGKKEKYLKNLKIPLNGLHNIRNATAASAVAFTVGISKDFIKNGLKNFKGVQRRFTFLFKHRGSIFIDDYAHHPTEITEVLNGVKDVYKKRKIICVFQPHRISRVKNLRKKFSKSFKKADEVILCPIYKAGENSKTKINYDNFAKEIIKNSGVKLIFINDQYELSKYVRQCVYGQKIVIGMGAGTISNWMKMIPNLI